MGRRVLSEASAVDNEVDISSPVKTSPWETLRRHRADMDDTNASDTAFRVRHSRPPPPGEAGRMAFPLWPCLQHLPSGIVTSVMPHVSDAPPVIEVQGLCKRFGALQAVDDLSFSVRRGDVYGFLGQNGAGKSTTIRMLLTLIRPSSGSIRMFGMDLSRHRSDILARVGAVIEKPDLYGYLTGRENLRILARLSGCRDRNAIGRVLDTVGLTARADDRVRTYSQGMRQRLGIAGALVHDPELVILDEPTNGLDPQGIADIRHLILRLSREGGKTFLVSSHLLSEMELVANRMVIIHKGRTVVEGDCRTLLDPERQVVHLETLDDTHARSILASSRWAAHVEDDPQGRIRLALDRTDIPQLVRDLAEWEVQVLALRPFNRLEDYFLSLTQAG